MCMVFSTRRFMISFAAVPPPTLAFVRVPDTDVTLRHGDTLTLTCSIQFEPDDDVDSVVTVDGELSGPGLASVNTVTELSPLMYELTGEVTDLQATATPDTYTCTVIANPGSSEMNVIASAPQTITEDVTVGEDLSAILVCCKHAVLIM